MKHSGRARRKNRIQWHGSSGRRRDRAVPRRSRVRAGRHRLGIAFVSSLFILAAGILAWRAWRPRGASADFYDHLHDIPTCLSWEGLPPLPRCQKRRKTRNRDAKKYRNAGRGKIPGRVDIDERPKTVENRARVGRFAAPLAGTAPPALPGRLGLRRTSGEAFG
ncbi:MAG: hypothetical protein SPG40_03575 [Kiritimatiellia bacterium]|nr:hypothetical protein [Kiritimatiellia bacterium]